jgi:hypothetical protein
LDKIRYNDNGSEGSPVKRVVMMIMRMEGSPGKGKRAA